MLQRLPASGAARLASSGTPAYRAPALPRPSSARPLPRAAAAYGTPQGSSTPALDVVPFTKEDANTISLIGNVSRVELKKLSDGAVAIVGLAVNSSKKGVDEAEPDWCAPFPVALKLDTSRSRQV